MSRNNMKAEADVTPTTGKVLNFKNNLVCCMKTVGDIVKNHYVVFATIISLIISIGAYSKDSIFVRYFIHKNKFSVVSPSNISGVATSGISANNGFYKIRITPNGEVLTRIHMLQYINIRNDTEDPQDIGGILVEFDKGFRQWIPLQIISPYTSIYHTVGGTGGLTHATTIDFMGNLLEENIAKGVIPPHGIVSGWLFLEFPDGTYNNILTSMRIRIFSSFGESEVHKIRNPNYPSIAKTTKPVLLKFGKEKRDISSLQIVPENKLRGGVELVDK
jgi:hypothetical protein